MDRLDDLVIITEVDDPAFAAPIFRRKFAAEPPDFEHHVIAFLRPAEGVFVAANYVHLWLRDDVGLIGGAATDGRAFARLAADQAERIRAAGGLYLQTLRWTFAKFADRCEAFFGYCGDARAWEVDMAAGFEPTQHPYLIAHWHRRLGEARRGELVARVNGWGPF
ncbi:hypothetical protein [Arenimonas composti]|uniref:GNAT family N-acetyltransferase n=1 Tax=Arenimonas composti TR7-09 = DSM 18010 TaxID=1121013 RepID=A0A091BGG4_9GAMM|nr:hypothetical protein [Arenimonas composti]KFN50841.1 hypothetical protein P873_00405 [Arenimonas composti TR7-09 = DSM 18010]